MEPLYVLNIVFSVAILFWPVWFSKRVLRLPTVNPFTITMVIGLPVQLFRLFGGPIVLIDEGLLDTGYQFALFMGNIQLFLQTVSLAAFYSLFKKLRIERNLPMRRMHLSKATLKRAEYIFLGLFGLTFYLLSAADFGVLNWILNPREGYQLHRTGLGHWYALATSFLGVAFLFSVLARPSAKGIIVSTAAYVVLGYFLGSKGTIFTVFIAGLIFLWFIGWEHLIRVMIIGSPVVFCVLLVNLYLAMSEGFGIQAILEYFDHFKNASSYYHEYFENRIELFHGEVLFSNIWSYVPRAFWPDKPVVYGILLVNEIFFPGQADLTNTPAFGGAVEQFADFGVAGVIFFSLFSIQSVTVACLSYFIFRRPGIDLTRVSLATVFLLLVNYAPMFGSYFPAGLYFVLLLFVLTVTWLVRKKRRSRKRNLEGTGMSALPEQAV